MPPKRGCTFSVVFIVCCGLLVFVMATSEASRIERNSTETFRRMTRDRRRYCGKVLSDTLAVVCKSYPSPWQKKSAPISVEDSSEGTYREQLITEIRQDLDELEQMAPDVFDVRPSLAHPFFVREYQRERPSLEMHPRVRRQIVDECCRRSCTLKTLKQYCAE